MADLFDFDQPPPLFAVMGNPVNHSLSPTIHQQFAAQFNIELDYQRIHVDHGGFSQAADNFFASGGQGLNITVPFKLEAWNLCDQRQPHAEVAGAVNTLWLHDQELVGDNTDGIGMVRDITQNVSVELTNKDILIMGAGGAVRGVLAPVLDQQPASLTIVNRTVDKAIALADDFVEIGQVTGLGYDQLRDRQFDVVINGTAASLQAVLPPLPNTLFKANALAYDMMYASEPTVFMSWARQRGAAHTADGLGMLIEQAAESFSIWHGKQVDTVPVLQTLRSESGLG